MVTTKSPRSFVWLRLDGPRTHTTLAKYLRLDPTVGVKSGTTNAYTSLFELINRETRTVFNVARVRIKSMKEFPLRRRRRLAFSSFVFWLWCTCGRLGLSLLFFFCFGHGVVIFVFTTGTTSTRVT